MPTFARINPDTGAPETRDFDVDPQRKGWLPLVIDAQPVPSATQRVEFSGYVFEPTQVRQPWALVDKTADELEAEALQTEKQQITTYLADLQVQLDVSNATRAALTNSQRIDELEKDTRVLMKSAKYLLRQAKRSM